MKFLKYAEFNSVPAAISLHSDIGLGKLNAKVVDDEVCKTDGTVKWL